MAKYSENELITAISERLTTYQNFLIKQARSGRTMEQSLEPEIKLTHSEMKRLTGRRRMTTAFLLKITEGLESEGLEVVEYDSYLIIKKLADNLPTNFSTFLELESLVSTLNQLDFPVTTVAIEELN